MPNDRIAEMIERVNRIEANAILSPADAAILDLCKSLINEVQMLDAELSVLNDLDAPTGCADDTKYELSGALRKISPERLNYLLNETLKKG